MGPVGSPLSKIGVQVTDSYYVLLSMRVMTRVSPDIWRHLAHGEEFVRCLHSVGKFINRKKTNIFLFQKKKSMSFI